MTELTTAEREIAGGVAGIGLPAFIGREPEMAALAEALSDGAAVVLIEGEAGIGKSRLLREYLSAWDGGARVLTASCPPFHQPHTLGPVVDALRQATDRVTRLPLSPLAGALRPLFPEWADDLPAAPEMAEDATTARHRLFRALAELFRCLRVDILAVEDAQWADEASVEFLLFLAADHRSRVSLLVTCRPEEVAADSLLLRLSSRRPASATLLRLALGPLDLGATARMVSSMLAVEGIPAEFAEFLHKRTDGVPLAVEELVRLMGDRADLACRDEGWVRRHLDKIDVPPTIRDAVLERIERLTFNTQSILRAAAVLTYPADEATLIAVSGLPAAGGRTGLADALRSGLLAENDRGQLSFRHMLASRAVYEAIPAPERRMMHLRAGRALETHVPQPVPRLAGHFRQGGEIGKWCQYAEHAADLAIASGDITTAIALLRDMLAHAQLDVSSVIRLTDKIPSPSLTGDPRFRDVVHALRSALDTGVPDPAEEAEVRFQLGRVLFLMEEYEAARGELERAVPHLSHNPVYGSRAMMMLSWPRGPGRASIHAHWLRRAAELSASIGPLDRLRMTVDRATALLLLGDAAGWAEAAQIPDNARTSQETWEITRGNLNIGHTAMMWGRYDEARQRLAMALDLASRHQYLRYHAMVLGTQAHLDWRTGAWHKLAERAAALAHSESLPPISRLEPLLVTAQLYAVRGKRAEAQEILRRMCDQTQRRGVELECIAASAALARLLLGDGDPEAALRVTDWSASVVAEKGTWLWATELAPIRVTALLATGRADQAAELTCALAGALRKCAAPAPQATLGLCRAILASARDHHDRAERLYARTAAAWHRLPRPYGALLARERQAGSMFATGRAAAAVALLSEVRQGFLALGATFDAERVAGSLRDHGAEVPLKRPGGRRGYGKELSPREKEVVRLLMVGRTSQEIAQALSRSPNTVDTQVKSAMRKFGVSSRAALAVRAAEAGLDADTALHAE